MDVILILSPERDTATVTAVTNILILLSDLLIYSKSDHPAVVTDNCTRVWTGPVW